MFSKNIRRTYMKKIIAVLLVLAMVFALAACGSNNNATPANNNNAEPVAEKKVLKVATKGDPKGLCNAITTVASFNTPAHQLMMDRLFEYDSEKGYTWMLATNVEVIDGSHYRLTLRDDVYSWNGDKFKASDVVYSIKSAVESTVHDRYYGNFDVENCKAEDDTHVVIALKKSDPFILTTLCNIPYGMMVEASVVARGGLDKEDGNGGNMPNCYTGPYIPVEWSTGPYIKFVRNEKYWGGTPYFDEIYLYSQTDQSARTNNLLAGEVDIALEPAENQAQLVEDEKGYFVYKAQTTNHHTLFTNVTQAPFDDVNVRIACALALNYDQNIKTALSGFATHSDSILPLKNPQYSSPQADGYESFYTYNLEKAKEYMLKSKYAGTNPKVELLIQQTHETYATLIQQQLAEIGITVTIRKESNAFYDTINAGTQQCWIVNNSNANPYEQLKFYDGRFTVQQLNGGPSWRGDAKVDELFDSITAEADFQKATPYYKELQKILNQNVPSIPLYSPDRLAYMSEKIDGIILTCVGDINFSKCYFK